MVVWGGVRHPTRPFHMYEMVGVGCLRRDAASTCPYGVGGVCMSRKKVNIWCGSGDMG